MRATTFVKRAVAVSARVLVCGAWLALAACDGGSGARLGPQHPWISPPRGDDDKAVTLPAWLTYRVAGSVLDEAVAMLADEPWIQMSPAMANHFAGVEVRVPAEMRPFLVRGVAPPGAEFSVVQSMSGLWVRAAGGEGALQHAPLVVLVDPTPREIFVTVE